MQIYEADVNELSKIEHACAWVMYTDSQSAYFSASSHIG